jgi:glycosyltransferase involved in cell wall biosynthesis
MRLKKVLIIAYTFPPRCGSGSVRPMGLAKYLPQFGWEPLIMTANLPGPAPGGIQVIETDYIDILVKLKGWLRLQQDLSVNEQLGISVRKDGDNRPILSRMFLKARATIAFPDQYIGWFKFAVQEGKSLLEKENIEAIISTSPPATAHLIARKLKEVSGKPWIADLRDLWTQNHYYRYGAIRHFIERKLELKTLSRADALITAHPLVNRLRKLHKWKPIYWILNGFDSDDFPKLPLSRTNNKFIMTYTGVLYRGKRDPELLFQALLELIKSGEIKRTQVEVRFFTLVSNWLLEDVRKYNLQDVVKIYGRIPREEALRMQMGSALLLILTWNNSHEASIYPGKIFEYLGAQRPILAIGGPGGVVKELLEKTRTGIHVSDLAQLKKTLMEYYQVHQTHGTIPYHAVEEEVQNYTHQVMAQKFGQVLDGIIVPGSE